MSDQPIDGLEVYVRGNVAQNTRGYNKEHTVTVKGRMSVTSTRYQNHGELEFWIESEEGDRIPLGAVLDALHQEADHGNQREIDRQRQQQLAAIQAGT